MLQMAHTKTTRRVLDFVCITKHLHAHFRHNYREKKQHDSIVHRQIHRSNIWFPALHFRSSVSVSVPVSLKPCPYSRSVAPLP